MLKLETRERIAKSTMIGTTDEAMLIGSSILLHPDTEGIYTGEGTCKEFSGSHEHSVVPIIPVFAIFPAEGNKLLCMPRTPRNRYLGYVIHCRENWGELPPYYCVNLLQRLQ